MTYNDGLLSFLIETEPDAGQATTSVDVSVSEDATEIETDAEGTG